MQWGFPRDLALISLIDPVMEFSMTDRELGQSAEALNSGLKPRIGCVDASPTLRAVTADFHVIVTGCVA